MQPLNQRPVMDISAPERRATPPLPRPQVASAPGQSTPVNLTQHPTEQKRPAGFTPEPQTEAKKETAPALSVHEPPKSQSQSETSETSSEPTPASHDSGPTEAKAIQDEPAPQQQPTPAAPLNHHPAPPLPVGAIVGAIFVMAALAAAAILVYIQTQ